MALTKYNEQGLHYWAPIKKIGGGWIAFKSSPSAPTPPDPNVVAAAQTRSNIDTANANAALNRTDQITPWGTQAYTQGTPNPDGTAHWTSTTTLDPAQQRLLDSSNGISQSMADLGQRQLGNVASTINTPLDFSGLPALRQGALQSSVTQPQNFTTGVGTGGIQRNVDMRGVPALVGGDALAGAMKDAQNASYAQQTGYLDPQWRQDQHDLENKLTQQGVMQNSDAWNRAVADQSRNKTFAYQQALASSVGLGNAAQAQLYGQGLSSNQNAYGQALSNGNFTNSAQAQQFGQDMANAQLNNSSIQNRFNNGVQGAQLNNQAQGQDFAQSGIARNQGLNELMTEQQNPLNVLNAIRTGAQVTAPQFGSTPQTNVAGTDTMSPVNNAFNGQMGAYNGQVATGNANTSAVASTAAAAIAAAF